MRQQFTSFYVAVVAMTLLAMMMAIPRAQTAKVPLPAVNDQIYGYHFHIYFLPNDTKALNSANDLMTKAKAAFPNLRISLFNYPIGPHPIPMFEIDLEHLPQDQVKEYLYQVLPWVMLNVDFTEHPVLLHPLSDNELADHTVRPAWFGQKLILNIRKL